MTMTSANLSYDDLRQIELQLFADIRRLSELASQLSLPQVEALRNLQALIASNRFAIAVVGEFKRGKSTFINALLGDEVLPAAIEACSATLNRITYGRTPRARVVLHGEGAAESRSRDVPLAQLADYVTKLTPESRQMSAAVEEAVISFPSHFCRNNVDLIDTPGLNDDDVMTRITLDAVGRVNAAILVIRASIPFGESEQRLLEKLLEENIRTIVFVVTAIDEIDPANRERLLVGIRTRIKRAVLAYAADVYGEDSEEYLDLAGRFTSPAVYGLSGYLALEARREKDLALEQESGLPAFEQVLEDLLAAKDGAEHVRQVAQRLAAAAEDVDLQITARSSELSARLVILERCASDGHAALAALAPRLQTLRAAQDEVREPDAAALTTSLKIAAARLVEQLALDIERVVHAGLYAISHLRLPIALPSEVRAKLERIAAYTPGLDVEPITSLTRRVGEATTALQDEALAQTAADARTRLEAAYTRGAPLCADIDAAVAAASAELDVAWPDHPLRRAGGIDELEQRLQTALAQLIAWEEAARRQGVAAHPLQLQPAAVALRTAVRVFPEDPRATPPLDPEEAMTQLRQACIRSLAGDIDQIGKELGRQLRQLTHEIAEPATLELCQIPARKLAALLDSEQGLAATLRKARTRLEGRTEAELRDLELRQAEVGRIAAQARQLLRHLRREEGP